MGTEQVTRLWGFDTPIDFDEIGSSDLWKKPVVIVSDKVNDIRCPITSRKIHVQLLDDEGWYPHIGFL